MQVLELLRDNLEIFFRAIHGASESCLIEETGNFDSGEYYAVYELNDELFLFHFSHTSICRLVVFENVPAALDYLHAQK